MKDLSVVQLNTGRSSPVCDAILSLAYEQGADVVCLQEPWYGRLNDRIFTKSHPGYKKFLLSGDDEPNGVFKVTMYIAKGVQAF